MKKIPRRVHLRCPEPHLQEHSQGWGAVFCAQLPHSVEPRLHKVLRAQNDQLLQGFDVLRNLALHPVAEDVLKINVVSMLTMAEVLNALRVVRPVVLLQRGGSGAAGPASTVVVCFASCCRSMKTWRVGVADGASFLCRLDFPWGLALATWVVEDPPVPADPGPSRPRAEEPAEATSTC